MKGYRLLFLVVIVGVIGYMIYKYTQTKDNQDEEKSGSQWYDFDWIGCNNTEASTITSDSAMFISSQMQQNQCVGVAGLHIASNNEDNTAGEIGIAVGDDIEIDAPDSNKPEINSIFKVIGIGTSTGEYAQTLLRLDVDWKCQCNSTGGNNASGKFRVIKP